MSNRPPPTRRPRRRPGPVLWDDLLRQSPPAFAVRHIPEPELSFRGGGRSVDPRTGIELFGPVALDHGPRSSVRVGVIGTGDTITRLRGWVEQAKVRIDAGMNARNKPYDPFLAPSFPGFTTDAAFGCDVAFTDRLTVTLTQSQIDRCLSGRHVRDPGAGDGRAGRRPVVRTGGQKPAPGRGDLCHAQSGRGGLWPTGERPE